MALNGVSVLTRPAENVYYQELDAKYRTVRVFLPTLVKHVRFGANSAGGGLVSALDWLQANIARKKPAMTLRAKSSANPGSAMRCVKTAASISMLTHSVCSKSCKPPFVGAMCSLRLAGATVIRALACLTATSGR